MKELGCYKIYLYNHNIWKIVGTSKREYEFVYNNMYKNADLSIFCQNLQKKIKN